LGTKVSKGSRRRDPIPRGRKVGREIKKKFQGESEERKKSP